MKLKIALISFIIEVIVISSILINNESLIKIQLILIILFGYFTASFGTSYFFDRINTKALKKNQQEINPYKILKQLTPYINGFIFGFFGILTLLFIILLILFT